MERLELDYLRELLAVAIESKDTVADIILDFISRVYESGYEKGLHKGYKEGLNEVDAYQVGLTYGWECALNIHYMSEEKVIAIFGGRSKWAVCTVTEAIAKIKEYEEKQTEYKIKAEYDEETRSYSYMVDSSSEKPNRSARKIRKEGVKVPICSNCYMRLDERWNYCPHCGSQFEGEEE